MLRLLYKLVSKQRWRRKCAVRVWYVNNIWQSFPPSTTFIETNDECVCCCIITIWWRLYLLCFCPFTVFRHPFAVSTVLLPSSSWWKQQHPFSLGLVRVIDPFIASHQQQHILRNAVLITGKFILRNYALIIEDQYSRVLSYDVKSSLYMVHAAPVLATRRNVRYCFYIYKTASGLLFLLVCWQQTTKKNSGFHSNVHI